MKDCDYTAGNVQRSIVANHPQRKQNRTVHSKPKIDLDGFPSQFGGGCFNRNGGMFGSAVDR